LVPSFDRCLAYGLFPCELPEGVLKCRKISQSAFSIFFATSIENSFIIARHVVKMHRLTVTYRNSIYLFHSRFGRGKAHVILTGVGKRNTFFFSNI
jgi:hypothetical protein